MNAADSPAWREYARRCGQVFTPERVVPHRELEKELPGDRTLRTRYYQGPVGEWTIHGSENQLLSPEGRPLYSWRCLNDSGELQKVIRTKGGGEYLLFRRDLYGYSVLDLVRLADFHYIPGEAYPEDPGDAAETFIWTGADYDPGSGLLAVTGCIWACPFSVAVVEFSDPMALHERWIDLHDLLEGGYDRYDDIDFEAWDPGEGLVVRGRGAETGESQRLAFPRGLLKQRLEGML